MRRKQPYSTNEFFYGEYLNFNATRWNARRGGCRTKGKELPATGRTNRDLRTIHAAKQRFCVGQLIGRGGQVSDSTYAARNLFASCRTSSLSILYFNVLNGIPRYSAVAVTFQPLFSSARKMKFRSKAFVATSNRLSVLVPSGSSWAK